jgi:polysaccharide pyruvyl transferase WcaK-like protein
MKINYKIVVTHVYSDSNKGDSAISNCTVDAIRFANPNNSIVMQSTFTESDPDFSYHNRFLKKKNIAIEEGVMPSPYVGSEKHIFSDIVAFMRLVCTLFQYYIALYFPNTPNWLSKKQKKAVSTIRNADMIVLKGGQYIYNNSESIRGWFFLWRTLLPIQCATKLNKKVILFGQSIGPFKTRKSWAYALKILLKCHKIVLREKLSLSMFEGEGLQGDNRLGLSPDLAFLTIPEHVQLDQIDYLGEDKRMFGVTIVNWSFPNHPDPKSAKKSYIDNLVDALKKISIKYEIIPVLIPQVSVRHHGSSDLDLLFEIQKLLSTQQIQTHIIEKDLSAPQMAGLYGQCQFLIGTRLHSCILAATAGVPVIAIKYQGFKTQGVMDDLEMSEFVHDIACLKSVNLCKSVDSILNNRNEIIQTINKNVSKMRDDLHTISKELFG